MDRTSFLVDEHVPRVFTTALRSSGFEVVTAQDRYGQGSVDATLLEDAADADLVVLTNDRDFVQLAEDQDHAGIVLYTDRGWLVRDPISAVTAVAAIDRYYGTAEWRNVVEWLDNWR